MHDLPARDGYWIAAVQNPALALEEGAAVTRRVTGSLDGPVVLVGHSYGAAAITEAGAHETRELPKERKIPYPPAGAPKERRKQ